MKQLKIVHLADIHFAPDKKAEALASLETAYETGKKELVDLFVIAGDLFERPSTTRRIADSRSCSG